ncbi:MAG: hypothetical protein MR008_04675 [Aerococcus sp.]|nr:hypothetical protein [Aerococcus sp.]
MGILFTATNALYLSQRRNLRTLSDGLVAQAMADKSLQLFQDKQLAISSEHKALRKAHAEIEEKYRKIQETDQEQVEVDKDKMLNNDETNDESMARQSTKEQEAGHEVLDQLEKVQAQLDEQLETLAEQQLQLDVYRYNLGQVWIRENGDRISCKVQLASTHQMYTYDYPQQR